LNYFENLMKTPWLCWNHLKTFLASFMLLHFLIKTFSRRTWKLFHLMCRTFPPFQSHLTKELSKISHSTMLQASTRENIQTWGETQKTHQNWCMSNFHLVFPPFVPSSLWVVHYTMCFEQQWGTCPDFFLFYKKHLLSTPS
jgi:hypothetical protein